MGGPHCAPITSRELTYWLALYKIRYQEAKREAEHARFFGGHRR